MCGWQAAGFEALQTHAVGKSASVQAISSKQAHALLPGLNTEALPNPSAGELCLLLVSCTIPLVHKTGQGIARALAGHWQGTYDYWSRASSHASHCIVKAT